MYGGRTREDGFAEGGMSPLEKTQLSLPSGREIAVYKAQGEKRDERVFVVDEGLPDGVKLLTCGWRQSLFEDRCAEVFDEILEGNERPASGVLMMRHELEEDCDIEDGPGFQAECADDEIMVAALRPPPERAHEATVDNFLSSISKDKEVKAVPTTMDLERHSAVQLYVINTEEKGKPVRAYVVDKDLDEDLKIFVCAWRNNPEHDAVCLRLIDSALK